MTVQCNSVSPSGFEGPEKRLEIDFIENASAPLGLRVLPKKTWQDMCTLAKCTIIGHTRNEYFDSFVLSESSLFVFPYKVMIKTCGTTTLLNIIPKVLEYAAYMNLKVKMVMFSRKNFLFPKEQLAPHCDGWSAEVEYLNNFFDGTAYVLGPVTGDHWNVYLADYSDEFFPSYLRQSSERKEEKTLEIMMHNLDRDVAASFYKKEETGDRDKFPGMSELIPGSVTDEFNFSPCGYSMNGLNNDAYYTIHVTPEEHCSYASFESNVSLPSYSHLIGKVLGVFKPGRFTLTFFVEKGTDGAAPYFDRDIAGYVLKYKTRSELEGDNTVYMCYYESDKFATTAAVMKRSKSMTKFPIASGSSSSSSSPTGAAGAGATAGGAGAVLPKYSISPPMTIAAAAVSVVRVNPAEISMSPPISVN